MKVGRVVTSSGGNTASPGIGRAKLWVSASLSILTSVVVVDFIIIHYNKPLGFMHFFTCMLYCTIF